MFKRILPSQSSLFTVFHDQAIMNSPQRELVTDYNKSPLIQILAWMFLVIVVLACIARTGTKLYMVNRLKVEDWFAIVATVRLQPPRLTLYLGF